MRIKEPRKLAEAFIKRFAPKKVGGSKMLNYLEYIFDQYGRIMYKQGFKDGVVSRRPGRPSSKDFIEGYHKGYSDGENGL